MDLIDAVACGQQGYKIAGQGSGIAGHIGDAWRANIAKQTRHAITQAATGRVDHHQVGLMEHPGEDCAISDCPLSDRTLPGCGRFDPSLMSEFGQILLGPGVRHLSINRQIVLQIFCGCL
jgi:hypothetical protein